MRGAGARISVVWRACVALGVLAIALHLAPADAGVRKASSLVEVRGLHLSASHHAAALTVELDRATSFRLFTLATPRRVVLDLSDSRLARSARLPPAAGIIHGIRAGRRPRGGLRLVLQVDPAATARGRLRLPVRAHWAVRRRHGASRLVVTVGEARTVLRVVRTGAQRPRVRAASATGAHLPVHVAHAPARFERDVVIAVDAGHGGKDPGAIGPDGTEEKNVTLAIARALAARIDAESGMRAVLTRDSDVFLPLRERIRRARAAHADLFVSVHADSVRDRAVSGASVYILSEHGATDEAARWLAERENAADRLGGVSLADKSSTLASVLLDLSQSASISESMTAARQVIVSLDHRVEVRTPVVQQAGFVVLKSPDIPSMLIETAYISNPADERRLRTPRQQRKLASAIFAGLLGYFEQYPPAGTRFARLRDERNAMLAGAGMPRAVAPPTASATP